MTVPRPRDAARTSAEILAAASQAFAELGYAATTMRDIASRAGINVALVARYFGAKEDLFEAALRQALDMTRLLDGPRETFGIRVATLLTEPAMDMPNPLAMLLLAISDPTARRIAEGLLESGVIGPLAQWLGDSNARERALRITMLCSGYLSYQRLLVLPTRSARGQQQTRRWLAAGLQQIVDTTG